MGNISIFLAIVRTISFSKNFSDFGRSILDGNQRAALLVSLLVQNRPVRDGPVEERRGCRSGRPALRRNHVRSTHQNQNSLVSRRTGIVTSFDGCEYVLVVFFARICFLLRFIDERGGRPFQEELAETPANGRVRSPADGPGQGGRRTFWQPGLAAGQTQQRVGAPGTWQSHLGYCAYIIIT